VSNYQFASFRSFLCFWLKDVLAPDSGSFLEKALSSFIYFATNKQSHLKMLKLVLLCTLEIIDFKSEKITFTLHFDHLEYYYKLV
jgi:hypothetical protein